MTDTRMRRAARTGDRAGALREQLRSMDQPCPECKAGEERIYDGVDGSVLARRCRACAGTGLVLRPRVELAAYCGDEGALGALGVDVVTSTADYLPNRAGYHRGRTTCLASDLDWFLAGLVRWQGLRDAHGDLWGAVRDGVRRASSAASLTLSDGTHPGLDGALRTCRSVAGFVGEGPVKEAVRRRLIEWALKGGPI